MSWVSVKTTTTTTTTSSKQINSDTQQSNGNGEGAFSNFMLHLVCYISIYVLRMSWVSVKNDDNDENNIVETNEFRHTEKQRWRGGCLFQFHVASCLFYFNLLSKDVVSVSRKRRQRRQQHRQNKWIPTHNKALVEGRGGCIFQV